MNLLDLGGNSKSIRTARTGLRRGWGYTPSTGAGGPVPRSLGVGGSAKEQAAQRLAEEMEQAALAYGRGAENLEHVIESEKTRRRAAWNASKAHDHRPERPRLVTERQ